MNNYKNSLRTLTLANYLWTVRFYYKAMPSLENLLKLY